MSNTDLSDQLRSTNLSQQMDTTTEPTFEDIIEPGPSKSTKRDQEHSGRDGDSNKRANHTSSPTKTSRHHNDKGSTEQRPSREEVDCLSIDDIPPELDTPYKDYLEACLSNQRAYLHSKFLRRYLSKGHVPKGLTIHKACVAAGKDTQLKGAWQNLEEETGSVSQNYWWNITPVMPLKWP